MEISELTLKLIIILIPGALATIIFGKLILHKDWDSFRFILFSTLFGMFSYLTLQLIINVLSMSLCFNIGDLTIWESLSDPAIIPYKEVMMASIIAVLIAFFTSYIENRKIVSKIASTLKISNKYGEENLYSRFLNSKEVEYIYLRDIKNNLTYHGWVKSFSESDTISEIRLASVKIYSYKKSELLYEVDEVYLSFNKFDIIIELAKSL